MERDLEQNEFRLFHDLIHRLSGIHYPQEKVQLLSNRLRKRMRPLHIDEFNGYLAHIQRPDQRTELQQFLDSITTNETYFFRCQRHWDLFAEWVRQQAAAGCRSFRIWSAAASNGSEACTILIMLDQILGRDFGGRSVELLATDLSQTVLQEAREATYRPYALAQTQKAIVSNYFKALDGERFEFDRRLLRLVTFRQHNLMEALPAAQPFDFVFLRNVMIYFDRPSRERVLEHVHKVLRPDGRLLVGESESLMNVTHAFTYLKPSYFQRPAAAPVPARARR